MTDLSPEDALQIQQFAEKTLEEITKRAEADGMDPIMLHSAFCVAAVGWMANALGPEKTGQFLRHVAGTLEEAPSAH